MICLEQQETVCKFSGVGMEEGLFELIFYWISPLKLISVALLMLSMGLISLSESKSEFSSGF